MNKQPMSIPILTVIGMVFGGFGALGSPCVLCFNLKPPWANPIADAMNTDRLYVILLCVASAFNFFLSAFLLLGSSAGYRLKAWGRIAMLAYSWLQIANVLFITLFNILYVIPKINGIVRGQPAAVPVLITTILSTALSLIYTMALPIAILICFHRKNVIEAFRAGPPDKSATALN